MPDNPLKGYDFPLSNALIVVLPSGEVYILDGEDLRQFRRSDLERDDKFMNTVRGKGLFGLDAAIYTPITVRGDGI